MYITIITILSVIVLIQFLFMWALVVRSRENSRLAEEIIKQQQVYISTLEKTVLLNTNNVLKN